MAADQILSTKGLPVDAGSPKPSSELHDCWDTPFARVVSYAPYLGAYVHRPAVWVPIEAVIG